MIQEIKLLGGAKVWVDLSEKRTACRACGKLIWFAETESGKTMPIIEVKKGQYQSHFADCPMAKEFRRKRTEKVLDDMEQDRTD